MFDIALCGTACATRTQLPLIAGPSLRIQVSLCSLVTHRWDVVAICRTMACSSFFQNADPDEGLGVGPEAYCVTASLSVEYKAPVTPIPGVFRLDIVKDHIDGKRITVRGELVNVGVPDKRKGTPDTVLAVGEAVGSNISAPRTPRL